MERLTLGVAIPAYNAGGAVRAAILSVLEQQPPADELVVVDDGSTDDTVARLREWEGRLRLVRQANQGPAAARNNGWLRLCSELVTFLDADDALLPGALAARRAMFGDPQVAWGYTDGFLEEPGGTRRPFSAVYPPPETAEGGRMFAALLCKNFITASSLVVRRSALDAVGGFDEAIRGTEDWELCLRLSARFRAAYSPRPTFVQRTGESTYSRDRARMDRMRYESLVKAHRQFPGAVRTCGAAARRSVADAHNALGLALGKAGRWGQARGHFRESVRLWPLQRMGWSLFARSLLARGTVESGGPMFR